MQFRVDDELYGMLQSSQIEDVLSNIIDDEWTNIGFITFLECLLPTRTAFLQARTQRIIGSLPISVLILQIRRWPIPKLRLLSDEQWQSKEIPWAEIITSQKQARELFPMENEDEIRETRRRLHLLSPETIQQLSGVLSEDHKSMIFLQTGA